jgi:hypothetical protein
MADRRIPSVIARRAATGFAVSLLASLVWKCPASAQKGQVGPVSTSGVVAATGVAQSDTALRFPYVPDPAKTPGAALPVSAKDICVPGYSKRVRDVPIDVKRSVYASYGVDTRRPGEYEIDHLISLQLGGSNSIRNLWPQSFRTSPWNAYAKDALEDELHRRVCAGTLDLTQAQQIIAQNWVRAYRIYVRPNPLPPRHHMRHRTRQQYAPRSLPNTEERVP